MVASKMIEGLREWYGSEMNRETGILYQLYESGQLAPWVLASREDVGASSHLYQYRPEDLDGLGWDWVGLDLWNKSPEGAFENFDPYLGGSLVGQDISLDDVVLSLDALSSLGLDLNAVLGDLVEYVPSGDVLVMKRS